MILLSSTISLAMKLNSNEIEFEIADSAQKQFLVNFAIRSNDIYDTRRSSREVAEEVFDIDQKTFLEGGVRVLKYYGEIVGFFTLKVDATKMNDSCVLGHLFVKAGLQRNGFGSILFDEVIRVAQNKGFKKLTWISDPDAKEFYIKKGAHVTHYEENLLNPGVDVPIFSIDF